ncbi:LapA family protein [Actinomycetospora rhizophila]|uniref:LapA family protein n=1 Tax=Actinomycetospora rhizophila TaxID=1416876 RepID=A0ABV9Z607_9PSEU
MTTHGPVAGGPPATGGRSGTSKKGATSRRVVALVLLAVAVVFVLENRDLTEIRLLIPVVLMPLWAALTITLVLGLVAGWLVGRRRH